MTSPPELLNSLHLGEVCKQVPEAQAGKRLEARPGMGLRPAANSDQMSCPRRRNCCAVCARVCVSVYKGVHVCGCVCVHRTVRVVFAHVYTCVYTHGSGEPPVHLTTRTHVYACMGLWTRLVTACVCTPVGQVGPHPAPKHTGCLQWPQRTLKNIASCQLRVTVPSTMHRKRNPAQQNSCPQGAYGQGEGNLQQPGQQEQRTGAIHCSQHFTLSAHFIPFH